MADGDLSIRGLRRSATATEILPALSATVLVIVLEKSRQERARARVRARGNGDALPGRHAVLSAVTVDRAGLSRRLPYL